MQGCRIKDPEMEQRAIIDEVPVYLIHKNVISEMIDDLIRT